MPQVYKKTAQSTVWVESEVFRAGSSQDGDVFQEKRPGAPAAGADLNPVDVFQYFPAMTFGQKDFFAVFLHKQLQLAVYRVIEQRDFVEFPIDRKFGIVRSECYQGSVAVCNRKAGALGIQLIGGDPAFVAFLVPAVVKSRFQLEPGTVVLAKFRRCQKKGEDHRLVG